MIALSAGDNQLLISPEHGGRLLEWCIAGTQVLAPLGQHPIEGGCYLMAPWVGRIANATVSFAGSDFPQERNFGEHAIHGTFAFKPAEVVSKTESELVLRQQTTDAWPQRAEIELRWQVHPWGMESHAKISAETGQAPAAVGWHPWFLRNPLGQQAAEYGLNATLQMATDANGIGTGLTHPAKPGPHDDSFISPDGSGFIEWPGFVRIDMSTSGRYVHLFDAGEHVCIEPQTAPPNAPNLLDRGFGQIVTPSRPLQAWSYWRVSPAANR